MRKPCDINAIVSRVRDLSQILKPLPAKPDPENYITETLLTLGFSTKHNGFAYLREAILLIAKNPYHYVTKLI